MENDQLDDVRDKRTSDVFWSYIPSTVRKWATGIIVGVVLGSGTSAAISRNWPDANVQAIDATMKAVMDRIDKLEQNDVTSGILMIERQRVGDTNSLRITNIEGRITSDIIEIKAAILRLGDKLDRHSEFTENKLKPSG